MPMAIPIIAVAASVAASSAGAVVAGVLAGIGITISAATAGALLGGLAALSVSFVGSAIFGTASAKQNSSAESTSRGVQIRSPVSPHQIIVGTVKVSGTLVYIYSPPSPRLNFASCIFGYAPRDFQANQLLYMATVLSSLPPWAIDLD